MVFHDERLERLVDASGLTTDHTGNALSRLKYRGSRDRILGLGEMLDLVGGRVPLLIEVKSEWQPADARFLDGIARLVGGYKGPAAIMSFDPAVVAQMKVRLPRVPRGIVSGRYRDDWWPGQINRARGYRLTHLLESLAAEPHFYAYHVDDLPTPVTRFVREGVGLPLFAWTVRTKEALAMQRKWADAPIFEAIDPRPAATGETEGVKLDEPVTGGRRRRRQTG
jgi:glycerophosphoryl diester phosphodiesterase